jgi:hypothetical protein
MSQVTLNLRVSSGGSKLPPGEKKPEALAPDLGKFSLLINVADPGCFIPDSDPKNLSPRSACRNLDPT